MNHQVDYIIVGCGLAGIAFCEQLREHGKTFLVFDNASQQSSLVAAGLFNPVILKRFSSVWKAEEQLEMAIPYYKKLESRYNTKLIYDLPIYRRFSSVAEQNEWFTASDKPQLAAYLFPEIISNTNPMINAPLGFGKVLNTGRIDTNELIHKYHTNLITNGLFLDETFDYEMLDIGNDTLNYKGITAKTIVFAEGFGMVNSPFFKDLPLNVAKGELITINAPDLNIDFILKSSIFIIPEGNHKYLIGATYDWDDKTNATTKAAKNELTDKLKDLIDCEFEVVNQSAGIRPTVKDRRPLVGVHKTFPSLGILNGLGTRGVMIAPYAAEKLYQFIENGIPLEKEMDIRRFD